MMIELTKHITEELPKYILEEACGTTLIIRNHKATVRIVTDVLCKEPSEIRLNPGVNVAGLMIDKYPKAFCELRSALRARIDEILDETISKA